MAECQDYKAKQSPNLWFDLSFGSFFVFLIELLLNLNKISTLAKYNKNYFLLQFDLDFPERDPKLR